MLHVSVLNYNRCNKNNVYKQHCICMAVYVIGVTKKFQFLKFLIIELILLFRFHPILSRKLMYSAEIIFKVISSTIKANKFNAVLFISFFSKLGYLVLIMD